MAADNLPDDAPAEALSPLDAEARGRPDEPAPSPEPVAPGIEAAHFRRVLGHFASGITIVTAIDAGTPIGMTAQSFTSLSLDPPLVAFAPADSSSSWPRMRAAGRFCVNILRDDQEALSRTFATRGADKFGTTSWHPGAGGVPRLDGCLAWIDCTLEAEHDAGDHVIAVGRVQALATGEEGAPLLFYRGAYGRFCT